MLTSLKKDVIKLIKLFVSKSVINRVIKSITQNSWGHVT